ncbi:MAG: class I SAM-dependent methyltransferase [Candidatus Pacebacteria bacterium]|jgi:ubiquinone/menaquinone biosynthesis C-methylase UbiE|nr:class I SAM-dependent methyltransferase [Candidatus Paceibacterota bacterium]
MEDRKTEEIEYYEQAGSAAIPEFGAGEPVDFEGFKPLRLSSFRRAHELLEKNCMSKEVLDWGCGNGVHTMPIGKMGVKSVLGIDLSDKLLEAAQKNAAASGSDGTVGFLKMDCEKTDFTDNSFDVIFDGGTFSSIDIEKAFPEMARILRPGGMLIGIETFGHNPLANANRARNVRSGKRTAWAASHIFNEKGVALARKYFTQVHVEYFHLFDWVLFPVSGRPWGRLLLDVAEPFDRLFLKIPFLKKYAFKVVFEFTGPIK